jgi:AhpD family alkylhydroperoxidase
MPRIQPITRENADSATANLLGAVEKKMGTMPNLISTMASSPAVAKAYLGFSQTLSGGMLTARLREEIALVVGETNNCDYCVAAHTTLGKGAGLSREGVYDALALAPWYGRVFPARWPGATRERGC